MRFLKFTLALALCITWILLLERPIGPIPALGSLLNPINGFWHQAEAVGTKPVPPNLPADLFKDKVEIELDERLVPHIFAQNDEDLYTAQGYLHAFYRLWQMDMQVRAAGGRLSEIVGKKTLEMDRIQRRKGMVWAAENALRQMEDDPRTKTALDAYTRGVNAFISSLKFKDYPLEYKLMDFEPEPWTNLKCALLLKHMADDLTGKVDDIALSYLHSALSPEEMNLLFPKKITGSNPVIPYATLFARASQRIPPVPSENIWADFENIKTTSTKELEPAATVGIGSNNWVIGPQKTTNNSTILCNDPHLSLNLPAIWYELQLQAPGINCYGVSIPGAPGIVIGFNDSLSWGMTNNYRDVKDYYEIATTNDSRFYLFDKEEQPFNFRYETIGIKDATEPFVDTIRYTIHGPVMYEQSFPEPSGSGKMLAMTWMAHRASNELLALYLMNRASNYENFEQAIQKFECPAQNFIYSDRLGNIALWGQGRFINKWKDQGKYVMRGDISATLWGDTIPMGENPKVLNPSNNYLVSANQNVTDFSYPYWYNGDFTEFRSWAIHHFLKTDSVPQTVGKMKVLQNNNYSILAANIVPLLDSISTANSNGGAIANPFKNWDFYYEAQSKEPIIFHYFWNEVRRAMWHKKMGYLPGRLIPADEVTMQLLTTADSSLFSKLTGQNRDRILRNSLLMAIDSFNYLGQQQGSGEQQWYQFKNTSVTHLSRIAALSYDHLKTGGWKNTINAMSSDHGPSWRMIVEMNKESMQAFVVYPGGQSGNPGSSYYNNLLGLWENGQYDTILFLPKRLSKQRNE